METDTLKKNFTDQLSSAEKQIQELEENLIKAKEYKLKLLGGLETLALLEENTSDESENNLTE